MMMIRRALVIAAASALAAPLQAARFQTQPVGTRPVETQPAGAATQPLRATIIAVQGIVQVREDEDLPWQKAEPGMVIGEGAEFRTGPRSLVQFTIPPDQTVTLDRLGVVKLLTAVQAGARIQTDLGMEYGRVQYSIEAAGEEHESRIRSPGATLAVRGTDVVLTDHQGFPPVAVRLTGRAYYREDSREIPFGTGDEPSTIVGGTGGPAETALNQTYVDPRLSLARSPEERDAILAAPLVTGVTANLTLANPAVVTPPPPVFPEDLISGSLAFQLVWIHSAAEASTPDLDLFVFSPRGEQLCAKGCPPVVGSGGQSPRDDQGGQAFELGQELAVWPTAFPAGRYRYEVNHVSGASAEFQVLVLRDGELVRDPPSVGTISSGQGPAPFSVQIGGSETPPAVEVSAVGRVGRSVEKPVRKRDLRQAAAARKAMAAPVGKLGKPRRH